MSDAFYICEDCGTRINVATGQAVPECSVCKVTAPTAILSLVPHMPYSFGEYKAFSDNTVSKEEYVRYKYLFALASSGIISNLELQVSYALQQRLIIPSRKGYKGFTQSGVSYSPDFRYQYHGVTYIEEYKYFKRTKKGTPKPGIRATARKQIKALIDKYAERFISHEWRFVITAWNKQEQQYYAFNANGVHFDYDLANYVAIRKVIAA